MAKSKLSTDYIDWVIRLNATQAQEEYHKLNKCNKDLQKQANTSRKTLSALEAQGKRGKV